jgi:hypothetical protein
MAMARAVLAARRSPLDFEERLVEGEAFSLWTLRWLRFSAEHRLSAGCPAQPSEPSSGKPAT